MKPLSSLFQPLALAITLGSLALLGPIGANAAKLKGDCAIDPDYSPLMDGKAKWESRARRLVEERFSIEVEDGPAGALLTVSVNTGNGDVDVAELELNAFGFADLNYRTDPDGADEMPFPDAFPSLDNGGVVKLKSDNALVGMCELADD